MLEAVIGMFSTPGAPLYRTMGSGVLSHEALRIAAVRADNASPLGWNVIMARSGDRSACLKIADELRKQKFKATEILSALLVLLPDNLCGSCNGSGLVLSQRGDWSSRCKHCKGSGRRTLNLRDICKKHGADVGEVERAVNIGLMAQSDAEVTILRFLRKEKSDL